MKFSPCLIAFAAALLTHQAAALDKGMAQRVLSPKDSKSSGKSSKSEAPSAAPSDMPSSMPSRPQIVKEQQAVSIGPTGGSAGVNCPAGYTPISGGFIRTAGNSELELASFGCNASGTGWVLVGEANAGTWTGRVQVICMLD